MDKQNEELTNAPPTYNEAVLNEMKGRQQYEQVPLQPQNLGLQLSEDIPDIPEQRHAYNQYMLGRKRMYLQCPSCHQNIRTKIIGSYSETTHLISAILCALGCCCCMFVPYWFSPCKAIKHYCPNCKVCVGERTLIPNEEDRGFIMKSF